MCHIVDNSDHWEHRDKSLTRTNFLRYGDEWLWRIACFNGQNYQNRVRHSDYLNLFHKYGWMTSVAEGIPDAQSLSDLRSLPLAAAFNRRDHRDLPILTSKFVVRRRPVRHKSNFKMPDTQRCLHNTSAHPIRERTACFSFGKG